MAKHSHRQLWFAVALAVFLRLPSFRWPVISDDDAIYDAMAGVVNSGGVVYREAVEHRPPGLAYFYSFFERLAGAHGVAVGDAAMAWVHFGGILMVALTVVGIYWVASQLMKRELAVVAALLYGVVSATKCADDGLGVNAELLMNAPTAFAVGFLLWGNRKSGWRRFGCDLAAGALVAFGGIFKWQALIVGLSFPFFGLWKDFFKRAPAWILGLLIPIGAVAAFFQWHGALQDALRWGIFFNFRYISDGPGFLWGLKRFGLAFASIVIPSAVIYFLGLREFVRAIFKDLWRQSGMIAWTVSAMLAICVGWRFFGHYLLQLELPLSIWAAAPVAALFSKRPKTAFAFLAVPAGFFFALSCSPSATRALFDPGVPDWARVGSELAHKSRAGDTLLVWGNIPPLYHYSGMQMGTRFSFCNYMTGLSPATPSEYDPGVDPNSAGAPWDLLLGDLEHRRPDLVLDTAAAGWKGYGKFPISRYPAFSSYLHEHYRPVDQIEGAILYRRMGSQPASRQ